MPSAQHPSLANLDDLSHLREVTLTKSPTPGASIPAVSDPSLAALVEQASKVTEDAPKAPSPPPDPRLEAMRERVYTFQFSHTATRGKASKEFSGTFTNTVPSVRDLRAIGLIRARLNDGVPNSLLDALTDELTMIIAHLSVTLGKENRPAWSEDLSKLDAMDVLYALWDEVTLHEATFLGGGKPQAPGKG